MKKLSNFLYLWATMIIIAGFISVFSFKPDNIKETYHYLGYAQIYFLISLISLFVGFICRYNSDNKTRKIDNEQHS
jgi:uncharacterized membrane protein